MRIFSFGIFWGAVVILFGVNILLKSIFHINIPFFRIILGIMIIFWGISIIFGGSFKRTETISMFGHSAFDTASKVQEEYNVIFGTSVIDLSSINFNTAPSKVKVNTIFANTEIIISRETEVELTASSAFANVSIPNGDNAVFGTISRTLGSGVNKIRLDANAVFGQIRVIYKN